VTDRPVDPLVESGQGRFTVVLFHDEDGGQLTVARDELLKEKGFLVEEGLQLRAHGLSEVGQDAAIQAVGFGQEAEGAGKVADLARVDHDHGEFFSGQGGYHGDFQAASRFQDNARGAEGGQALDQGGQFVGVVGRAPGLLAGEHGQIEMLFGDIDADERFGTRGLHFRPPLR